VVHKNSKYGGNKRITHRVMGGLEKDFICKEGMQEENRRWRRAREKGDRGGTEVLLFDGGGLFGQKEREGGFLTKRTLEGLIRRKYMESCGW